MKSITTFITCCCFFTAFSQQVPLSTVFWNNYMLFNPAMTGLVYRHEGTFNYRNQWDKVNGAPNTLTIGYGAKIEKLHGGLGITGKYENVGFSRQTEGMLNYSFHWKLGEEAVLALGAGLGIQHFGVDESQIVFPGEPEKIEGATLFTADVGAVFHRKGLNAGISVTQLTGASATSNHISYDPARHYFVFADYLIGFSENVDLKPAVLLRTDLVKMSADFSIRAIVENKYWAGMSYRTSDAICFMGGWDIKERYRIGYAYDMTINKLSSISRGTHEIVLAILIK